MKTPRRSVSIAPGLTAVLGMSQIIIFVNRYSSFIVNQLLLYPELCLSHNLLQSKNAGKRMQIQILNRNLMCKVCLYLK